MRKATDPVEPAQLRTRSEKLEKHNSTLKAHLEEANQRGEDLKAMYNNYMLQFQKLIN